MKYFNNMRLLLHTIYFLLCNAFSVSIHQALGFQTCYVSNWHHLISVSYCTIYRIPDGTSGKESACQCRRCKRQGFNPWVGKIPQRRAWQPTPVFLPEESHGQRSLADNCPQGCKEPDTTEAPQHAHSPSALQEKELSSLLWLPPIIDQQNILYTSSNLKSTCFLMCYFNKHACIQPQRVFKKNYCIEALNVLKSIQASLGKS